jgi:hypothetical protein
MNRTTRGRVAVVAAAVALLAGVAAAPAAQADPKPISTARYIALAQVAMAHDGFIAPAARAEMATRPDLHSQIPTKVEADYELPGYVEDPDQVSTTTLSTTSKVMDSTSSDAQLAAAALTTSTASKDRYLSYSNTFFFSTHVLDYHFVVGWSYNGSSVVGTPSAYTYAKAYTGAIRNLGLYKNDSYRNYDGSRIYAWTMPLTGKWQECSGSTCDIHYPVVRFGVYYNGTYSYTVLDKA